MKLGIKKNKEDMRGLFFLVKGRHIPGNSDISSYDPELDTTDEWYMLMDCVCFNTIACGSNRDEVLDSLEIAIKKHKTREEYFRVLWEYSTEDYYQTHYLGKIPYTPKEVSELTGKKRARVSPTMKEEYKKVYELYGDHYADLVAEREDRAYSSDAFITPYQRSKRSLKRSVKIKEKTGRGLTKVKNKRPKKTDVASTEVSSPSPLRNKKKLRPRKFKHQ